MKDTFDDCSAECTKKCNARCDTAFKAGKNCLPWSHKGTEYDPSETLEVPVEDRGKERPKIKYPTLTQINTWFSFAKDVPLSDIVKEENVPHNFCRDPNKSGRIWCYVEDGDGGFVGAKCEPKSSTLHTHASDMYRIPYEVAEEMMDLRKNLREAENSFRETFMDRKNQVYGVGDNLKLYYNSNKTSGAMCGPRDQCVQESNASCSKDYMCLTTFICDSYGDSEKRCDEDSRCQWSKKFQSCLDVVQKKKPKVRILTSGDPRGSAVSEKSCSSLANYSREYLYSKDLPSVAF